MKTTSVSKGLCGLVTCILGLIIASGVMADPGEGPRHGGLSGKIFAVQAEITASLDPAAPAGLIFDNCYYFNEDGTWFDPLYPDFGIAVPGVWLQHDDRPKIEYTATVADQSLTPGLLLIQNGTVHPRRGKAAQKIIAYTTVFDLSGGTLPVVEVVSRGRAVDACPYF